MHIADIEHALKYHLVAELEDAFRALVEWPNEAQIENSEPSQRKQLLVRICHVLADDERVMPRHTTELLREMCTDADAISSTCTYGDGTIAVASDFIPFFRRLDLEGV